MKVLLIDTTNAFLTPGGKTTHALKLQQEISKLGVDIQFARWWDKSQEDADIVHFLGFTPTMVKQVKEKGMKTVFSMIFDFESNKSESEKRKRMIKNWIMDHLPSSLSVNSYWRNLPFMDRIQFMHSYDKNTPFYVHTWSEIASQYISLYKSLMGGVIRPSLLNMAA